MYIAVSSHLLVVWQMCVCVCVQLMVLDPYVVEVSDGDIPQILSRQLGKL